MGHVTQLIYINYHSHIPVSFHSSTCTDNVTYQVSRSSVIWFWRRFLKVFTICGHGGYVGHVTQLIYISYHSHIPVSFHMISGSKSPNCF